MASVAEGRNKRQKKENGDMKVPPVARGEGTERQVIKFGQKHPIRTSTVQLQQLLNELKQSSDNPVPYTFRIFSSQNEEVEIKSTLQEGLKQLPKSTTETALSVKFFPLATFRVQPVTRCTTSLEGHSEAVLALAFSPDCQYLASGSGDTTVRLWDLNTETPITTLKGHKNWVLTVSWSPCSRALASAGMDKNIYVWNMSIEKGSSNKQEVILKGHQKAISCLSWQPLHLLKDSQQFPLLASASHDATIRVWDAVRGLTLTIFSGHTLPVSQVRFSGDPDHLKLFSCSRDTTVKVWDAVKGVLLKDLKGHGHWVNTLALSTEWICQCGPCDHTADSRRKDSVEKWIDTARIKFLKYLKDSCGGHERIVTGSDDCTMILWQPMESKPIVARLTGHQKPVNHVQFSPDGRIIASASFDKSIRLWDATTGKFLATLRGHVGPVYRIAWSPDSNFLASASSDSTVKVWDRKSTKLKEDLPGHADEVYAVDWSIDGSRVATGSKDRFLKIWRH